MKNFFPVLVLIFFIFSSVWASEQKPSELVVQLPWTHQSQFTGMYVGQIRKHFEKEGLVIRLVEGGQKKNAATELIEGRADVALTGLGGAWLVSNGNGQQITNIAQIIRGSGYVIVCRNSAEVYGPKDIAGKKVGVWSHDEKPNLDELFKKIGLPIGSVEYEIQKSDGSDLVDKKVACASSMLFDEYLNLLEMGVPYSDLMIIDPQKYGVPVLLDGIYVDSKRLSDPVFTRQMVGFLRALREGWRETRSAPTLSLESVRSVAATFNKDHALKGLESMLTLIPADEKKFGLLDLKTFELESNRYIRQGINADSVPDKIWTHKIWNQLQKEDGNSTTFTVATKYYLEKISRLNLFKMFVYFGVFVYALSGVLEGIHLGYDLWGRLVLAFLSGIGGGTIRDLIIGGERIPFYYVKDYTYPLGIVIVVLVTSTAVALFPKTIQSDMFKNIKKYSDVIGFAVLAVAGGIYSVLADMPWYWVPALAALTCAGGGAIRDIVTNQEPHTFKGVIYEEAAVVGGLLLVIGFLAANASEHSAMPVYLSIIISVVSIIGLRLAIYRYNLKYPKIFSSGALPSH